MSDRPKNLVSYLATGASTLIGLIGIFLSLLKVFDINVSAIIRERPWYVNAILALAVGAIAGWGTRFVIAALGKKD